VCCIKISCQKKLWTNVSNIVGFLLKKLQTRAMNKKTFEKSLVVFVSPIFHSLKQTNSIRIYNLKFSLDTTIDKENVKKQNNHKWKNSCE